MANGEFDNLTVNNLSGLKGKVGIGTQDDLRVGYDYLSNKLEVKGGNVGIFGRLFVEPGQGDLLKEITPEVGLAGISIDRDDKTGIIYLQGYKDHFDEGYEAIHLALQPQGGNVGIGTTSPSENLTIQGDSSAPYTLNVGGTSNAKIKVRHLDGKDYQSGNLDNLYLQYGVGHNTILNGGGSNGKVGIGIDNPEASLHVPNGAKFGAIHIGTKPLGGDPSVSYETIQLPDWANLRINFGSKQTAFFGHDGTLAVDGNVNAYDVVLTGGDCAEDFDIIGAESIEPGTVMVIDNDGALRANEQAYDKRVAGVISGAGNLRPGITLDRQKESTNRLPLALNGKVYCKVDAEYDRVEVGDLLTTSETLGHAMKASDPSRSFGSVIGKALKPLKVGQGLIPILVSLQ